MRVLLRNFSPLKGSRSSHGGQEKDHVRRHRGRHFERIVDRRYFCLANMNIYSEAK